MHIYVSVNDVYEYDNCNLIVDSILLNSLQFTDLRI